MTLAQSCLWQGILQRTKADKERQLIETLHKATSQLEIHSKTLQQSTALLAQFEAVWRQLLVCRRADLMCCIPLTSQRISQLQLVSSTAAAGIQQDMQGLEPLIGTLTAFATVNKATAEELQQVQETLPLAVDKSQLSVLEEQLVAALQQLLLQSTQQLARHSKQQQQQAAVSQQQQPLQQQQEQQLQSTPSVSLQQQLPAHTGAIPVPSEHQMPLTAHAQHQQTAASTSAQELQVQQQVVQHRAPSKSPQLKQLQLGSLVPQQQHATPGMLAQQPQLQLLVRQHTPSTSSRQQQLQQQPQLAPGGSCPQVSSAVLQTAAPTLTAGRPAGLQPQPQPQPQQRCTVEQQQQMLQHRQQQLELQLQHMGQLLQQQQTEMFTQPQKQERRSCSGEAQQRHHHQQQQLQSQQQRQQQAYQAYQPCQQQCAAPEVQRQYRQAQQAAAAEAYAVAGFSRDQSLDVAHVAVRQPAAGSVAAALSGPAEACAPAREEQETDMVGSSLPSQEPVQPAGVDTAAATESASRAEGGAATVVEAAIPARALGRQQPGFAGSAMLKPPQQVPNQQPLQNTAMAAESRLPQNERLHSVQELQTAADGLMGMGPAVLPATSCQQPGPFSPWSRDKAAVGLLTQAEPWDHV